MRNFVLSLATAGILVASGVLSASPAHAALFGAPGALDAAVDELAMIHQAQNVYGGRRYCYYETGWRGPGWYWCGYGSRVGVGDGGPVGWRGWGGGGAVVRGGAVDRGGAVYRGGAAYRRGGAVYRGGGAAFRGGGAAFRGGAAGVRRGGAVGRRR